MKKNGIEKCNSEKGKHDKCKKKMQIEKYKCQDLAQSNIMIYVWNGILTYIIP